MARKLSAAEPPPTPQEKKALQVRQARYEVPSAAHEALGLWVRGVGFSSATKPHGMRDRVLGAYAAVLISKGRGYFECALTGRRTIKPGDLIWVFPTVPHSYSPEDGTWAEQWVVFGGQVAETFERQGFLAPSKPVIHVGEDAEVADCFTRIQDAFIGGGPLSVPMAAAIVHQLIVAVYGIASGQTRSGAAPADAEVAQCVRIVEQEAMLGLRPEDLAARVHVGYSTLRRRFKQVTGYSVKEYILRVQLRRAKELLAFTTQPVETIAREVGFEDPYYFSRIFRQREGASPTLFREQQENAAR